MSQETILVTGSRGLIGTALCSVLRSLGHDVRNFDIADDQGGFGDILSKSGLERAMQGCTGVVHLAAVSRVVWGEQAPVSCFETNVTGTKNVVDCITSGDRPPWLIYGSSREVYGQGQMLPLTEGARLRPMNNYARSKVAAEGLVADALGAGIPAAILRFSTVYGTVADHADRVIPAFCRAAIAGDPLKVEGPGNCLDITHVSDVAEGIANVASGLAKGHRLQPMHLTTGHGTSLAELAQAVKYLADSGSEIRPVPPRDFDVSRFVGDPDLAQRQIGWQPKTSLETGLAELVCNFRKAAGVSLDA